MSKPRPINPRLADNAYQAGYLMEHMRLCAERLERGVSPAVIAEALREVIENCRRAMGREPPAPHTDGAKS